VISDIISGILAKNLTGHHQNTRLFHLLGEISHFLTFIDFLDIYIVLFFYFKMYVFYLVV
jgi:hypothetical protein